MIDNKGTITVSVENVGVVSTRYEAGNLLVSIGIDGKVLDKEQFKKFFNALETVHAFHGIEV